MGHQPVVVGRSPGARLLLRRGGTCAAIAVAAGLLLACSRAQEAPAAGPKADPVPVVMGEVLRQSVPVRVEGIGNAEAINSVAVKSRADGQIVGTPIGDGAAVRQGEVIFEIDPRPFVAQLKQAEANLARDQAQATRAAQQDKRNQDLLRQNFISPDAYAQIKATLESAEATVAADRAAVDNARLQLEYATIRAPIAGRVGKILVTRGNLVKANDTVALAVINQLSPIYVDFAVPEQVLANVREAMARGHLPVTVSFATADGRSETARGWLAFVDNSVDPATGTVKLRAQLENKDALLWPGQFVHAAVELGQQADALVVPSRAIQTGPRGSYVYVVDPARQAAALREVAVDRTVGAVTVIAKGLVAGEKIVLDGQSRLVPGSLVVARKDTAAP